MDQSEAESPPPQKEKKYLSVREAAFIGVGSMVGAGIFALLGAAGAVAGAAVWLSFLIAGAIGVCWAIRSPGSAPGTRARGHARYSRRFVTASPASPRGWSAWRTPS